MRIDPARVQAREQARPTHDYTRRGWGHDYTFTPRFGGLGGTFIGWGHGLQRGDYLAVAGKTGPARYRILRLRYARDPRDMWFAEAVFAPRLSAPVPSTN